MSREVERFTGDDEMARLMRLLGQHLEARVLALVVQKASGELALVAPSDLEFKQRLNDCLQHIAEEFKR